MKAIENKQFLCPENKFGKCLLKSDILPSPCVKLHFMLQLAFIMADIFASFGVLPLSRLRAYTLQDATF